MRLTTKELSSRTWMDFERLMERTNLCHCACMLNHRAPGEAPYPLRTRAALREKNMGEKRELVDQRRAHGILVYEDGEPVGWCQFGTRDELPRIGLASAAPLWRVTCFVTHRDSRGRGIASTALRAALGAVRKRGGGVVQSYPVAVLPGRAPRDQRWDRIVREKGRKAPELRPLIIHREGPTTYYCGRAFMTDIELEGAGRISAAYRRSAGFHSGTVDMFAREGFEVAGVVPVPERKRAARLAPTRVVMQRTV